MDKMTKRIKKVFTSSSQVYHLWANQSQDEARQGGGIGFGWRSSSRGAGSRAFFHGVSAYSYGMHYEVGRIVEYNGVKLGIVNNSGYSSTTGKHVNECYSALDGLMPRIKATTFDVFEALLENQESLISVIMNTFNSLKFRSIEALEYYINAEGVGEFNTLCRTLGHPELVLNIPKEFLDLVREHIQIRLDRQKELDATAEIRREAKRAADLVKNQASIEQWKRGEIRATAFISSIRPMLIRVKDSTVQTSAGAEVPLNDAITLLKAVESNKVKIGMKVGSFTFDSIKNGIVKIGCHTFKVDDAKQVLSNWKVLN
jgi:hypothetical protein